MSLDLPLRYMSDGNSIANVEKTNVSGTTVWVPAENLFAPPPYTDSILPKLTSATGTVIDTLDKFLALPFTDNMKVNKKSGVEINVRDAVLALKKKYETLQGQTLTTVGNISSYSSVQQNYLKKIALGENITPQEYILDNNLLVLRCQAQIRSLASKTNKMTQEFQEFLDVLGANLISVKKRIEELQAEIKADKAAYSAAVVTAILEGILGGILTAVGIALLVTGVGAAWAPGLVMAGVASFGLMIKQSVDADRLRDVINTLENVLATCLVTKSNLEQLIPLMAEVLRVMGDISLVWDDMKNNLEDEKAITALFSTSKTNPDTIAVAVRSWENITANCKQYVDVVNGYKPSGNALNTPGETSDFKDAALKAFGN